MATLPVSYPIPNTPSTTVPGAGLLYPGKSSSFMTNALAAFAQNPASYWRGRLDDVMNQQPNGPGMFQSKAQKNALLNSPMDLINYIKQYKKDRNYPAGSSTGVTGTSGLAGSSQLESASIQSLFPYGLGIPSTMGMI